MDDSDDELKAMLENFEQEMQSRSKKLIGELQHHDLMMITFNMCVLILQAPTNVCMLLYFKKYIALIYNYTNSIISTYSNICTVLLIYSSC